jgi:PadR family transcriptional regulator, regulatory protein PadR
MAKNPEHRDLFPGALEIMILQSLRLKPMHGYALVFPHCLLSERQ